MASLLTGLLAGIASWFGAWFSKKVAMGLSLVAVFTTLTAALTAALWTMLQGLVVAIPTEWACYIGMWIPNNFSACVSAIVTAKLLRWAYDIQVGNAKALAYVT